MGNHTSHNGSSGANVQTITYPSGNVYVGTVKRGKRHGKGKLRWRDGCSYDGDWVANKQHGFGCMVFPNGNRYEGRFNHNNIDGDGTLRTLNGEIISGVFRFKGRSVMVPNAHQAPVGTYELHVDVTDTNTGFSQRYDGPASIHLTTGLVVLPGMENQVAVPVMPFAVAATGREMFQTAIDSSGSMQLAQPVVEAQPVAVDEEQRLIDAEEQAEFAQENAYYASQDPVAIEASNPQTSIAFGVHDQALNRPGHVPPPRKKVELFDPRNYF